LKKPPAGTRPKLQIFPDMAHAMMLEMSWRKVADYLLNWLERAVNVPLTGIAA
jgi:hypothetical protein